MIAMTKETDLEKLKVICAEEGVEYSANVLAFTAKDKEECYGYSLFFTGDKLHIINVKTPDILWNSIGDGLFRATLNYAVENKINSARIEKSLLEKLKGGIIPLEKATETIEDCEAFLQDIKKCGR